MRVALVTPFHAAVGGSTKVDNVLGEMYPDADWFSLFADEGAIPKSLRGRNQQLSYLNSIPFIAKIYRGCIPLFPSAIESLELRGYDLIISSDSGLAKAILVEQRSIHICYCHTPWHQIWNFYREALHNVPWPLRPVYAATARRLREFDFLAAQHVDHFIANSQYISNRIRKCYRRPSTVIYPPVDVASGFVSSVQSDFYLCVGRLSHMKRVDILISACNALGRRLIIVGQGREEQRLKSISGPTIEFIGYADNDLLAQLYSECRALLFAADEDFGIVPIEAQSYGRPVIAYGHGGSLETVRVNSPDGLSDTGVYFGTQSSESVATAITNFEKREVQFQPESIREHASRFDTSAFVAGISHFVSECLAMPS